VFSAAACGFQACGGSAFSTGGGDDGGAVESGSGGGSGSSGGSSSGGSSSSGGGSGSSSGSSGSGSSSGILEAGPPLRWCEQSPQNDKMFCEDFDNHLDAPSFLASWSTSEEINGTFSFDRVGVPSPPNALHVVANTSATVLAVKTFLTLPAHPSKARLEFDLRINSPGSVGVLSGAGFAAIAYGPSIDSGYAALAITNGPALTAGWAAPGDAGASDAGTFQSASSTAPFPPTQSWAGRFAIEIDFPLSSTTTPCVQIYQGLTALLKQCMALPPSMSDPSVLSVIVGDDAVGFGATGVIDLEFDNLWFDVR
jgi:hypothetical protein